MSIIKKVKPKNLSSIVNAAIKAKSSSPSSATAAAGDDTKIKLFVSSIDASSSNSASNSSKTLIRKNQSRPKSSSSSHTRPDEISKLNLNSSSSNLARRKDELQQHISFILCGDTENGGCSSKRSKPPLQNLFQLPWFGEISNNSNSVHRKERARERKGKWVFKSTQFHRFDRLVKMCSEKLGSDSTLHVFGKLGRETGIKEYNALIALCIEEAKKCGDEEDFLQQIYRVYQLFQSMKEEGFSVEEETYGQFLVYLIEMSMIKEFHFFCDVIKDANPAAFSRLGYYEMRLWIGVDNKEKIKELCSRTPTENGDDICNIRENYFLALCECNRKEELLQFLETIDINRISSEGISSEDYIAVIFKSLGMLSLESYAEKFFMACKDGDFETKTISHFIYNYVMGLPNLEVDGIVTKFKDLHEKLEVAPSLISYKNLIMHCCDSQKVHVALNIIDDVLEAGLLLSLETFHLILRAAERSCEFNLVHRIYSLICRHNLKPNNETFRMMITLSVKMKDFAGAYGMLKDVEKLNLIPSSNLYNAIMAGYFREKNISGGLNVLKQMELADVKPDSHTFSYLISNCCDAEEDIIKYCEELECKGVQFTKHVYMSLINAHANCGQFEKAKQVASDKNIPQLKSTLVSALASHGQISDALSVYKEVKESGDSLEPKAIIALIEHLQSGQLSTMLQLLKEIKDPNYWPDGCSRVILYCVRYKQLSSAVDLLKQLKDRRSDGEEVMGSMCDELFAHIAEEEPVDVQNGLQLLQDVKEKLEYVPTRKSLDFLLSACVKAKDLSNLCFVWNEYAVTGLPYNILSYLRMYQGLLASGDHKAAANMRAKIPKDDLHVCIIIKACQYVYAKSVAKKKKKKNKK